MALNENEFTQDNFLLLNEQSSEENKIASPFDEP
jgi:hypothetical protein